MKRSNIVLLAVVGTAYGSSLFYHSPVYRDQYGSRQQCERDWGGSNKCEEGRSSGTGTGRYYGPSYEEGARPTTREPGAAESRSMISRSGFGRSGAHFTGGG
jgi:hypothetical protein